MLTGIVVITHGNFGNELVKTALNIVGQKEFVATLSVNRECPADKVCVDLDNVIAQWAGVNAVLILVDMMGGTPCNLCMPLLKKSCATSTEIEVVTGVNLMMLVSALNNRETMEFKQLVEKVVNDGKKNVQAMKQLLLAKLKNQQG
ncbi:MAG: PTS sugar transporter subunit IIA [Elusimicrobiota bacterium]